MKKARWRPAAARRAVKRAGGVAVVVDRMGGAVHRTSIYRWMRDGSRGPTGFLLLEAFATAVGCPIEELRR